MFGRTRGESMGDWSRGGESGTEGVWSPQVLLMNRGHSLGGSESRRICVFAVSIPFLRTLTAIAKNQ